MKKLIFVLVLLPAILTAQKPYLFTGEMNMQYGGASYLQKFNSDSVSLSTSKKAFSFNKDIYVRGVKLESLSLVDDIFDFQTNKYTPYAAKPTGLGFYTGTEDPNNETRINLNGFFYTTGVYIGSSGSRSIFKYGTFQMLAGSSERLAFNPGVTNTASAVAYLFDTQNNLTTSGAKLYDFKNAGVTKSSLSKDGDLTANSFISTSVGGSYHPSNLLISHIDYANPAASITNTSTGIGLYVSSKIGSNLSLEKTGSTSLDDTGNAIKITRNQSGTGSIIGHIIDIEDTPTTSGTKNYNVLNYSSGGTTKLAISRDGYIKSSCPHAFSKFMDSTIVMSLTQNTWYQITRQSSKNSWPESEFTAFTSSNDTIIAVQGGHYTMTCKVNLTGVSSKEYEYRVMKKSGSTSTEVWRYQVTGTGIRVLRDLSTYINLSAGDKFWFELRCISLAPGDVTLHGGEILIHPVHLYL